MNNVDDNTNYETSPDLMSQNKPSTGEDVVYEIQDDQKVPEDQELSEDRENTIQEDRKFDISTKDSKMVLDYIKKVVRAGVYSGILRVMRSGTIQLGIDVGILRAIEARLRCAEIQALLEKAISAGIDEATKSALEATIWAYFGKTAKHRNRKN